MMTLNNLFCLLAFAPPQTQPGQKPPPIWVTLAPIGFMVVVMWLIMIRPQQKEQKRRDEMLKAIKKGDKVSTSAGILGIVVSIKEKSVVIRSEESKFEVLKSAVTDVIERSGDAPPSADPAKN